MGLIADRLSEARNDPGWLTRGDHDDVEASPSGVRVTPASAMGLSTFWRCVDLISNTVSLAPTSVVVRAGGHSFPEYGPPPRWMVTPDPDDPNYLAADYFGECTLSMLTEGNYFSLAAPYVWDPQKVTLLDPRRVAVRNPNADERARLVAGPRYDVLDARGHVVATVGPERMLHGWWMRMPGEMRGISPLEALRRGIGGAIAADDFAARYFGQGASLSFGVEYPGQMTQDKKDEFAASLRRRHAGLASSHAIGILTQGAKFVAGLAPTPEQSQMLETRKYGVEDISRIFGVPPGMVGSQQPGAASYASAVEWRKQFRDDSVLKFTTKLERQHARLLRVPDGMDPATTVATIQFDLDWVARTDMLARFQSYGEAVAKGIYTPNEARRDEGLPPMDGGDHLYMQQQMVPVSDLGRTKLTEPMSGQRPAA